MNARRFLALAALLALAACVVGPMERSWHGYQSPIRQNLLKLLEDKKTVAVALLASADTAYSDEMFRAQGQDREQWKKKMVSEMLASAEQELLEKYGKYPNFHIVDRAMTDKLLQETSLSATGVLPNEVRLELGKTMGATYLISHHLNRHPGQAGIDDVIMSRLIDIQTGAVLAAQSTTLHR